MKLKDDLEKVDKTLVGTSESCMEGVVSYINNKLNIETPAAREFLRYALANALLMDRKQKDYGPHNIGQAGTFGCVIRMQDKLSRLLHLFNGGRRRKATNESITDSFRDLSNYAIIAMLLEDGKWPGYENKK